MKRFLIAAAFSVALLQAQNNPPAAQTPKPNADPYANNPDAGKLQFPLAAPAGKDKPLGPASRKGITSRKGIASASGAT